MQLEKAKKWRMRTLWYPDHVQNYFHTVWEVKFKKKIKIVKYF